MNIKEYKYVLEIARTGSISTAAKNLCISQPSLSEYIKKLERGLGFEFFTRKDGKFQLTELGRKYVEYAQLITSLDERLHMELDTIHKEETNKLKLGITPIRAGLVLPVILPVFRSRYPNITLEITEVIAPDLEDMIRRHQIDVAISGSIPKSPDLKFTSFYREEVVLIAASSDDISELAEDRADRKYPYIDITKLRDRQFILIEPQNKFRILANTLFSQAGIVPNVLLETSNIFTAYKMAAAGCGLSFMSEGLINLFDQHKATKIYSTGDLPIILEMGVIYQDMEQISPLAGALLDVIEDTISYDTDLLIQLSKQF